MRVAASGWVVDANLASWAWGMSSGSEVVEREEDCLDFLLSNVALPAGSWDSRVGTNDPTH